MSIERNNQIVRVFNAFNCGTYTMKEVDVISGIMRENICRYVKLFRENNQIYKVRKRVCSITGYYAYELTTNPDLVPKQDSVQLELF